MSKSILIIDTPKNCKECPLKYDSYGEYDICAASTYTPQDAIIDDDNTKLSYCPLRPLPPKKDAYKYDEDYDVHKGWNDCLDEIIGEKQ